MTKILSIDGGGIRGVIPAMVLHHIEKQTGKPIASLFDVIAGTSTGGILALGLTCPGDGRKPRYSAQELVALYEDCGEQIFPHALFGKLRQLTEEKYDAGGLEQVLRDKLGDALLSQALTDVIVTAYDIGRRKPVFFRSKRARDSPADHDFPMRDVARATAAAPTYFEPVQLPLPPPGPDLTLVDGGVFANNPGMCAFVDAHAGKGRTRGTLMVSLGTGILTRPIPFEDARSWGLLGWARPILDVVFDGISDSVDYQLAQILDTRYHRFQTKLDKAHDDMDDASAANIENLKLEGDELIDDHRGELDEVCAKLSA